jgi:hypothetical protein
MTAQPPIGRRAELTFKPNLAQGRHGWLRLTPAYSVALVEQALHGAPPGLRVLDPFAGTATTPLVAATHGHEALALDINPFLVWFGNAKLARYRRAARQQAEAAASEVVRWAEQGTGPVAPAPRLRNVERWWAPETLQGLCTLKGALDATVRPRTRARDLLLIAFCRTAIECSNAAFDHPSMSFGDPSQARTSDGLLDGFRTRVDEVLQGVKSSPSGRARITSVDARTMQQVGGGPFDRVITSPPYPNRMSYIRELRPYMYWTGFLQQSRDAGEIDWQAIGGTWGVATSRLGDWTPDPAVRLPPEARRCADAIARSDARNGPLLANYVMRYFEDMARHFHALRPHVRTGGHLHYIVGNSKFYDVLVPTAELYASLMEDAGFVAPSIETIRKRNSKKELFEYAVRARAS